MGQYNGGSGSVNNTFSRCGNFGTIKGKNDSGGIAGNGSSITYISECFNMGTVSSTSGGNCMGGIIGSDAYNIINCYNTAAISNGDSAAGIIGKQLRGTMRHCYNAGDISGATNNNQLGLNVGSLSNCYCLSTASGNEQGTSKTVAQLTSSTMPSELSSSFVQDTWSINGKYPILKWWRDGYFKFPIQFKDGSETVEALATYDYAATITAPTRSEVGYTFNGWYTAATGGTKAVNGGATYTVGTTAPSNTVSLSLTANRPNVVSDTITLYAQYSAKTTAVTLNGNGATTAGTGSVTATYNSAMPAYATAPQKTGYTFAGYYDAQTGGTQYYTANGTSARAWDKDVATATLYAQWTANDNTAYTVRHYYMDTAGNYPADGSPSKTDNKTGTTGATVLHENLLSTTIPDGCGYDAEKSGASSVIAADGSTVVKLYYSREKYTVAFKDGATTLDTQQVYYGGGASAPEVPTYKLYNDSQHYRFTGWNPATYGVVTGNLTVNAQYVPEQHNWSEKNWTRTPTCTDGGEYSQSCLQCGKTKTISPSSSGHDYRYADNGNGTHTVTCANCDLNTAETHTFVSGVCEKCGAHENVTVTFKDYKGDEIQTLTVPYNTVPVYTGGESRKQKPATASTTYTFENWVQENDSTKVIGAVTANTVYVPLYTETTRTYTVVFLNWNGDVLGSEEIAYGASAAALAPTAIKADGRHDYTFTGWSADLTSITKNTYAVAQFEATDATNYTVTFTDGAGNVLYATRVAEGEAAVYPMDDPAKEGHSFYGWDKDFSKITADLTVNALFLPDGGDMVGVTFVNYDNAFLKADVIAKGGTAVYGLADPEKPEDADNTYTFAGWDQALENVQANTVFTAQFTATPKHTHTYTFVPEQAAKCGVAGVQAHYSCTCGKVFDTGYNETDLFDLVIPALEHVWGDATYTWGENNATCTAERTCTREGCTGKETAEASVGSATTAPKCGVPGNTAYTATFAEAWAETQTANVPIDALEHVWGEATYTWGENNATCTAERTCTRDNCDGKETANATVTSVTTDPKCGVAGNTAYTATFEEDWAETQTANVPITALEHLWGETEYTWNEDHTACAAKRACTREGCNVEETADAAVGSVTTAPKCGVPGNTAYTATFAEAWAETQTANVPIDALEHVWGEATYTWGENNATCTAERTCTREGCTGKETETVETGRSVTVEPKCGVAGEATFTATFTNEAFEDQSTNGEVAALAHLWGDAAYNWGANNATCTAKRTCTRDNCDGEETANATVTSTTTDPKCGVAGNTAYTATFEEDWCETQTANVPITALEHLWGEPSYSWSADNAKCTAERLCTREGCTGKETETVDSVKNVTAAPACEAAGEAEFTATFTNEAFTAQTATGPVAAIGHNWGEWETVTPATATETGLEKRGCTRCDAEETRIIPAEGEIVTKRVRFVNLDKMHYLIDDEGGETYAVYNSSTVEWTSARPLRFRVVCYGSFPFDGVIVYANGTELTPDADGWYTLPKNAEAVTISAAGAVDDASAPTGKRSFWDLLLRLIRRIISFFTMLAG